MPQTAPDENQPLQALLAAAIAEATRPEDDEDAYWAAVDRVRKKGAEEVWPLVVPLAEDAREQVRSLVPDVLRHFEPHPLREATVTLLAQLLERETSPFVIADIAAAFVDLQHDRAADLLPPLISHPDASVRYAAVHGLLTVLGPEVVPYFVRASSDADTSVRSSATFGLRMLLGDVGDADAIETDEVKDALAARLGDEDAETRAEAIMALATRQDRRALAPLTRELADWPERDHLIDAAKLFAAPELFPVLADLLRRYPQEAGRLLAPLAACKPETPSSR